MPRSLEFWRLSGFSYLLRSQAQNTSKHYLECTLPHLEFYSLSRHWVTWTFYEPPPLICPRWFEWPFYFYKGIFLENSSFFIALCKDESKKDWFWKNIPCASYIFLAMQKLLQGMWQLTVGQNRFSCLQTFPLLWFSLLQKLTKWLGAVHPNLTDFYHILFPLSSLHHTCSSSAG